MDILYLHLLLLFWYVFLFLGLFLFLDDFLIFKLEILHLVLLNFLYLF